MVINANTGNLFSFYAHELLECSVQFLHNKYDELIYPVYEVDLIILLG